MARKAVSEISKTQHTLVYNGRASNLLIGKASLDSKVVKLSAIKLHDSIWQREEQK